MWQISEVFRSIQGEGIRTGVPSVFVRFAGCNLRCKWRCDKRGPGGRVVSTYIDCDTEYAQNAIKTIGPVPDAKALAKIILQEIREHDDIVFTGGEPTMQSIELFNDDPFMKEVLAGRTVTLETNGTAVVRVPWAKVLLISPKVNTIGTTIDDNAKLARTVGQLICANNNAIAQIKFTVCNLYDMETFNTFINNLSCSLAYLNNKGIEFLLMPISVNPNHYENLSREIVEYIMKSNFPYQFSDRLRYRLWRK